jgi:carboxy-terminal domain RNA polymerase II polypeptide A small phosphatase
VVVVFQARQNGSVECSLDGTRCFVGAGAWQEAPSGTSASKIQQTSSTREGESGHSHSAEQSSSGGDTQKEKASLLTAQTQTGTANTKHRRNKTSDTAHSAISEEKSGTKMKSRRSTQGKKVSIWKKLVYALKCQNPHDVEIDEGVKKAPEQPKPAPTPAGLAKEAPISEKPSEEAQATPKEPLVVAIPPAPNAEPQTQPPSAEAETVPVTPAPELAPAESSEPSVVVPPSPTTHVLPVDETLNLTSGAVVPPGSTGQAQGEESEESSIEEEDHRAEEEDEEERLILNGGAGIPKGPDGVPRPLLPPLTPQHAGRKCLVLDLDETLVHSSFKVSDGCTYRSV